MNRVLKNELILKVRSLLRALQNEDDDFISLEVSDFVEYLNTLGLGWTNVNDELPLIGKTVLVSHKFGVSEGIRTAHDMYGFPQFVLRSNMNEVIPDVKGWMEIPKKMED